MIIYFSGTGNSYFVAKKLSEKMNDTIVPMKDAANNGDDILTFVFPTYCYDIPPVVRKYIDELQMTVNQKVRGISVSGGNNGNSEHSFNELIEKKGIKVDKFLNIIMTDNSGPAILNRKINFKVANVDELLEGCLHNDYVNQSQRKASYKLSEMLLFNTVSKRILKKRVDNNACTGCGKCAKICPNKNIIMSDRKAVIGMNCAECFGCLHWCPNQAIHMVKKMDKANQYTNESVSFKEFNR